MNRFSASIKYIFSLAFLVWLSGADLLAQCSQCKAAAGSTDDGGNLFFGQNINTGVLYLLALPMFLPFIVGGIWYYKVYTRRKQEQLQASLGDRSVDHYLQ